MEFMINENMFEEEYKKMIRDIMNGKNTLFFLEEESLKVMHNLMKERHDNNKWNLESVDNGMAVIVSTKFTKDQITKEIEKVKKEEEFKGE